MIKIYFHYHSQSLALFPLKWFSNTPLWFFYFILLFHSTLSFYSFILLIHSFLSFFSFILLSVARACCLEVGCHQDTHTHIYIHTHRNKHIYTYIHTHTYIHTYIHTNTNTCYRLRYIARMYITFLSPHTCFGSVCCSIQTTYCTCHSSASHII